MTGTASRVMKRPSGREIISFELVYEGTRRKIECYHGEYRNLMVLINEKVYVEDFGECKGIGRCGTCLVLVQNGDALPAKERNEDSTLKKCALQNENLRLSCQLLITAALNGTVVTIVEERIDVR